VYFTNETEHPADLLRTEHRGTQLANALVVRARYRIQGKALVPPAPPDRLTDLRREPTDLGDHGDLGPDDFYPRVGTDVIVLGDAVAQDGPAVASRVEVTAGKYRVALDVFGDRIWEKVLGGGLLPSAPRPFTRMPVTWKNAFGGMARGAYGPLPCADNPMGKGYYLSAAEAEGGQLPNVESPGAHVERWDDRPEPVGLAPYPTAWGLRLMKWARVNREAGALDIHPEEGMFNRAHPALAGQSLGPGPMRIAGMSARGAVAFDLPPCPVEMCVVLGDKTFVRDLELEEVLVDLRAVDEGQGVVDLTYRKMFRYEFAPLMIRHTIVRAKGARE
jgi:hypothetical protein